MASKGKDMPRPGEICGFAGGIHRHTNGGRAIGRGNSGCDIPSRVNRHGEGRAKRSCILGGLRMELKLIGPFCCESEAYEPPAMFGHKVDCLRGNLFCGNDQVTFILPVFIIDQDDEFSFTNVSKGLFDGIEHDPPHPICKQID